MSTLKVNRIEPRTGDTVEIVGLDIPEVPEYPIGQVRAWVNFDGTGTVAIRESLNVSSITDNGVGHYTVNFTTAMPDVNYAVSGIIGNEESAITMTNRLFSERTVSGTPLYAMNQNTTLIDPSLVNVMVVR